MTTLEHYRQIILDYHHEQDISQVECNTKDDAQKLYGMLEGNNHIKNLKRKLTTITFDYN